MADNTFRLQARSTGDGVAVVKALIKHPNHNGLGRNSDGSPIPPHHLVQVVVSVNGVAALSMDTGSGIAADPLLGWKVRANPGDSVIVAWTDTAEQSGQAETQVA